MLFKFRFQQDDAKERRAFVEGLNFDWEMVLDEEKRQLGENLLAASPVLKRLDDENWFKVDWEKVPELVERRNVYLRKGVAYVPLREQLSLILVDFTARLEKALEVGPRIT